MLAQSYAAGALLAGWYRLVVELDARLAELDASYVVQQVNTWYTR